MDRNRRIIGWTTRAPESTGMTIRHAEAEKVVGGAVTCAYVEIADHEAAARAGAPADWRGPWRCLAIVAESGTNARGPEGAPARVLPACIARRD